MELFYCAAGNKRFAEIAIAAGFEYGARLPGYTYFPPVFADQEYTTPDLEGYLTALAKHRPRLATVIDWEQHVPLSEVLSWAESVAEYVETIIIIPKIPGRIHEVPTGIGGKPVRLGYSVKTRYGSTACHPAEFGDRPVHLLGGSPHRQMRLSQFMNAVSADGNYIQKMAVRYCQFWTPGHTKAKNRYFPRLEEVGDGWIGEDAPYEAFRRSCENVMAAWRKLTTDDYSDLPLWNE